MGYFYILSTVLLTAYGQVVIKWRMKHLDFHLPASWLDWFMPLLRLIFDPYVFSSFVAAFVASFTWMAALSEFELSFAYPFMSLAFVLVVIFGHFFLNEPLTVHRVLGLGLVMAGLFIASR